MNSLIPLFYITHGIWLKHWRVGIDRMLCWESLSVFLYVLSSLSRLRAFDLMNLFFLLFYFIMMLIKMILQKFVSCFLEISKLAPHFPKEN